MNAYKRQGHGTKHTSVYTLRLGLLAVLLMYVDDTDLLYLAPGHDSSDEEVVEVVQKSTTIWGELAQETGGVLNQPKCFLCVLSYMYPGGNGKGRIKKLKDPPPPKAPLQRIQGWTAMSHPTSSYLSQVDLPSPFELWR